MHLPLGGGLVVTAVLLGFTHGLEPDHVVGITALTQGTNAPMRSALVGGLFGAGHAVLVVGWIAGAYFLFDTTTFPPALEQFGLLVVGVALAVLSLVLGVSGVRRLLHRHEHDHDGRLHSHVHVHVPFVSVDGSHEHRHGLREYLTVGLVGALFTLSPPVSMIAFISVTMAERSSPLIAGVVAVYTVAIVATLAGVGGGAGLVVEKLRKRGEGVHAAFQVIVSVLVLAVAVRLLIEAGPALSRVLG